MQKINSAGAALNLLVQVKHHNTVPDICLGISGHVLWKLVFNMLLHKVHRTIYPKRATFR